MDKGQIVYMHDVVIMVEEHESVLLVDKGHIEINHYV